jgi:putative tricarboxylic transport membrane protein
VKVHDALTGAGLAALGGVVLWHVQSFPAMPGQKFGPAWFPGLVALGLVVCGMLLALRAPRGPWLALPAWMASARPRAAFSAVLAGLLAYVLVADRLGFHLTGLVLLLLWTRMLGAAWRLALPVALLATVVIHLAFYKLLRIPLPWGILERFAF